MGEYTGSELDTLARFESPLHEMLVKASALLEMDLTRFDPAENNFLDDELKSQVISYILSCATSQIIKKHNIRADFVTGYSMGIYAALIYCESLSFTEGLQLVRSAWEMITGSIGNGRFGMGMIIGLNEDEISAWCQESDDLWISNRNNPHTYVISGKKGSVERVLSLAREEGALRASLLPVSLPYHTRLLDNARQKFSRVLAGFSFKDPVYPYISSLDQKEIMKADELKEEVIRNITERMNWFRTMNFMVNEGAKLLFECGAGDGLTRNMRFIEGEFIIYQLDLAAKFIQHAKGTENFK